MKCPNCGGVLYLRASAVREGVVRVNCRTCAFTADAASMPEPLVMDCPSCGVRHIDEGVWATKPHKTHQCQACGQEWRPKETPTVGVDGP